MAREGVLLRGAGLLAVVSSCSLGDEGPAVSGRFEDGRPVRWRRSPVALLVSRSESSEVVAQLRAAAAVWQTDGVPRLEIERGDLPAREGPRDNGISELSFQDVERDCGRRDVHRRGRFCLRVGLEGLTELRTGRPDGTSRITEADVLLDERLRDDSQRLFEVALHEFGHVLGLEHAGPEVRPSVMVPDPPRGIRGPESADRRGLLRLYGGSK